MTKSFLFAVSAVMCVSASTATATEKVELKQIHMCCGGCAKDVAAVLGKVEGVTSIAAEQKTTSATFTAKDAKSAQQALDALAEAGFYGRTDSKEYGFKDDSGVKAGKVKSITITGFHNTCPGCVRSFRQAIKDVKGVSGDTAKSEVTTCEVTGDFDAAELVKALNQGGFHVKVKQ